MHMEILESTRKARVALGCTSSFSYAFYLLSKLSACIHNSSMLYEQILNFIVIILFFDKAPLEDGKIDTN